jgi:fatty acid desaturase
MRTLNLTRVAFQAELLRLKLMLRRQARRGVMGAIAAAFAFFLLAMLHLAGFEFLTAQMQAGYAALIVAGTDVVLALIFGLAAMRGRPSTSEHEASRISREARTELAASLSTFALVTPIVRAAGGAGKLRSAVIGAALTNWLRRRRA